MKVLLDIPVEVLKFYKIKAAHANISRRRLMENTLIFHSKELISENNLSTSKEQRTNEE